MLQLKKELTWQQRQTQIEQAVAAKTATAFSMEQPLVIMNPYGNAPLSALAYLSLQTAESLSVKIAGQNGAPDLIYELPAAQNHWIPIYGLFPGRENTVLLSTASGKNISLSLCTESLPENMSPMSVEGSLPTQNWIFTVPVSGYPAAYDGFGNCRWYLTEESAYRLIPSQSGNLLTCGPALLSPPYSATAIREINLLGKIVKEYRVPGGICHDFCELPDGNLLAMHQFFPRGTAGDMCVLIDRDTGTVLKEWDIRNYLPMNKGGSTSQSGSDWFHGSSVSYDSVSDSITIAGTYQDIILNLDFSSGEINWIAGDPTGWPDELVSAKFLQPKGAMEWFYEPTDAHFDGSELICFDCGHQRTKKGGTPLDVSRRYSRVVTYVVQDGFIREISSFGKEFGTALYSPYLSNCSLIDKNTCLMDFGGVGFLNNLPAEPPAFFQKKTNPNIEMQSVIVLKHDAIDYRLQLPINTYSASIISMDSYKLTDWNCPGLILGHWHGNDSFGIEMEYEDGGTIDEAYAISASYNEEQLIVFGNYNAGEVVMIILFSPSFSESYYVQSTRSPYLTSGIQTFAGGSTRPVSYVIDLTGLQGTFELQIGIDGKKYQTGYFITCGMEE